MVAGIALIGSAAKAQPNLVSNGGFELPVLSGAYSSFNFNNQGLTNWTILSVNNVNSNVELIRTYWQPSEGAQSLDLNGSRDGGISQLIATSPGQLYQVAFDLSINPDAAGGANRTVDVQFGSFATSYTITKTTQTRADMQWQPTTFFFTATSNSTLLQFVSNNTPSTSPYGVTLDNVKVVAAPEPGSIALSALGLVPLAGLVLRRRRTA
jgi:choice-of-anchor C domain-containing protein